MLKTRLAVLSLGIAMMLPLVPVLQAQAPPAPLPTQILSAKKVFIANGGGGFDKESWSGGTDRTYNEFYAAIKAWGHYEIVGTPADADLILQIGITIAAKKKGGYVDFQPWPQFRLVLLDPKTNTVLWALDEFPAIKDHDKEFEDALDKLVGDLKALTALPAAAAK